MRNTLSDRQNHVMSNVFPMSFQCPSKMSMSQLSDLVALCLVKLAQWKWCHSMRAVTGYLNMAMIISRPHLWGWYSLFIFSPEKPYPNHIYVIAHNLCEKCYEKLNFFVWSWWSRNFGIGFTPSLPQLWTNVSNDIFSLFQGIFEFSKGLLKKSLVGANVREAHIFSVHLEQNTASAHRAPT